MLQAACCGSEIISHAGESFSSAKGKALTPARCSRDVIPREGGWPTGR